MGLMFDINTVMAKSIRRTAERQSVQTVPMYDLSLQSKVSVKLTSPAYSTMEEAYDALMAQREQIGFTYGFLDTESLQVVSFYERL